MIKFFIWMLYALVWPAIVFFAVRWSGVSQLTAIWTVLFLHSVMHTLNQAVANDDARRAQQRFARGER